MATDLLSRIATEDDEAYTLNPEKRYKSKNGYHSVNMDDVGGGEKLTTAQNPFDELNDTFENETDPESHLQIYESIHEDIKEIKKNIKSVSSLRDNFNLSDSQKQYQSIMNQLDEIMMANSKITRKIKNSLKNEKSKNDKLQSADDQRSSSIVQWRVNALNSCVRSFKAL